MIAENREIHVIQQAFRQVMNAFARPGSICAVEAPGRFGAPECGMSAPLETMARMFIDQAVDFAVVASDTDAVDRVGGYLLAETRSRLADLEEAAFVVVPDTGDDRAAADAVASACGGSFVSPETGATVLVAVERVSADPFEGANVVGVTGPGVKGEKRFFASSVAWALARSERGDEYPCGVEVILVDAAGDVVCVPRSSTIVADVARGAC